MHISSNARNELNDIGSVIIDEDAVIAWIKKNLDPEDVFDRSSLEDWAAADGFVRPE